MPYSCLTERYPNEIVGKIHLMLVLPLSYFPISKVEYKKEKLIRQYSTLEVCPTKLVIMGTGRNVHKK